MEKSIAEARFPFFRLGDTLTAKGWSSSFRISWRGADEPKIPINERLTTELRSGVIKARSPKHDET
jgi:hypothetical protein